MASVSSYKRRLGPEAEAAGPLKLEVTYSHNHLDEVEAKHLLCQSVIMASCTLYSICCHIQVPLL